MTENEIGRIVVDTAVKVHKGLGPGLLESVYEVVLNFNEALMKSGIVRCVNGLPDDPDFTTFAS